MKALELVGFAFAAATLALTGACGGDPAHQAGHEGDQAAAFDFGSPADAGDAERTIEISALDPYDFRPRNLQVTVGETVTFVVTNDGDRRHEFVLGDAAYQDSHAKDMAAGHGHGEGNALEVAPGETGELTWRFATEGEVLYACHEPGHYEGGMVGVIEVASG